MSLTQLDDVINPRSFGLGDKKVQVIGLTALSGATSGTITADKLSSLQQLIAPSAMVFTAAKTYSGNVATLAFTVPAEAAASHTVNGIVYTATANQGAGGNGITIQLVDGTTDMPAVTNGNETVFVTGQAIVIHIDPTSVIGSSETNVRIAANASPAAAALITATGTSATVASVTAATHLSGGITGGIPNAEVICIG